MKTSKNIQTEQEMELVRLLMADCKSTGDIQEKLKRLFAGSIEQMLEAEMDEHLGYDKNSILGNIAVPLYTKLQRSRRTDLKPPVSAPFQQV